MAIIYNALAPRNHSLTVISDGWANQFIQKLKFP